jgi:hypothetical protein
VNTAQVFRLCCFTAASSTPNTRFKVFHDRLMPVASRGYFADRRKASDYTCSFMPHTSTPSTWKYLFFR